MDVCLKKAFLVQLLIVINGNINAWATTPKKSTVLGKIKVRWVIGALRTVLYQHGSGR